MGIVRLLDNNTINKIAAGEVVERPASCVKELVENAIDASANHIEVEILNGGKTLMRVTDDGGGMSKEDSLLAIKRHATSKLSDVRDLLNISTLGFRGEAVPTIASVSKFTLQTRRADSELGIKLKIEGGKLIDSHEIGCKAGTTVIVEDLFFNTPARLKFLKATATESGKIHEYIVKLALSRPEISFKFINNNHPALSTPGNGKMIDVITGVYGTEISNSLIEVNFAVEDFKLSGYIGKPNFLKNYRTWQTFIINGRVVNNRTISKALEESYRALIPKSGYPLAVLKIEVPQISIDVNVHPQKAELKFEDESRIFKAVYKSVLDAIRPAEGERSLGHFAAVVEKPRAHFAPQQEQMHFVPASKPASASFNSSGSASAWSCQEQPEVSFRDAQRVIRQERSSYIPEEPQPVQVAEPLPGEAVSTLARGLLPIGQVALTYIVAQNEEELYIIDQHAAHERILFDRLSAAADRIPAQQLLVHLILPFDEKECELVMRHQELFMELGFQLEPIGKREFRLMEVPADIPVSEAEELIREILAGLRDMHAASARDIREHVLATTACRAAIKAGEVLNLKQMGMLLDELINTSFPYTCPHGRPTILKFSSDDLAKMFKRTGFGL